MISTGFGLQRTSASLRMHDAILFYHFVLSVRPSRLNECMYRTTFWTTWVDHVRRLPWSKISASQMLTLTRDLFAVANNLVSFVSTVSTKSTDAAVLHLESGLDAYSCCRKLCQYHPFKSRGVLRGATGVLPPMAAWWSTINNIIMLGEAILSAENSGKPLGGQGSVPNPTEGAHSAPQTP